MGLIAKSKYSKTHGLLIQLQVKCCGQPVNAILDTGAQLNVCHEKIWKTVMTQPCDKSQVTAMSNVNGGKGTLVGLVQDVPINIRTLSTLASMYVGEQVPFDLLLGRPWQRGNYVSIDERADGTYLLFKDPEDPTKSYNKYELLVVPDGNHPDWDYNPATWNAMSTQHGNTWLATTPDPDISDQEEYQAVFKSFTQQ